MSKRPPPRSEMQRRTECLRHVASGQHSDESLRILWDAVATFGVTEDGVTWTMLWRAWTLSKKRKKRDGRKRNGAACDPIAESITFAAWKSDP
jgi:hypothetical protein